LPKRIETMKLKYRLFLSFFLSVAAVLVAAFAFLYQRDRANRQEVIELPLDTAAAGLSELISRQSESLGATASVLALTAGSTAKDAVASIQRSSAVDLVFFADTEIRSIGAASDRFTLEAVKASFGDLIQNGDPKKKSGLYEFGGKPYLAAAVPVAEGGFLAVAVPLPLAAAVPADSGIEIAFAASPGKWIGGSRTRSPEDLAHLGGIIGDEIGRISLSDGEYYGRVVRVGTTEPSVRIALLRPAAPIDQRARDIPVLFLLCLTAIMVVSFGISWLIGESVSRPLEMVVKAVREMSGSGVPSSAPASITERGDEIGEIAISFNQLSASLGSELKQKEKALAKLEKYQSQLLDLNHRLAKMLYENRVMLSLWKEQEKAEDTKDFLSHILEELLQGLPFHYGCIIIRPLAQIGPEVILARIERRRTGKEEVSITDILERSDRTLWLSSLSSELKSFLLNTNQETTRHDRLIQEHLTAPIEPDSQPRKLAVVSVRLAQGNQHMGSLHLITENDRFSLSPSEQEFLLSVAGQMSVALDNRSLQYATRVDPLTRLYNRGYMTDRLREEMMRSSRTNRPFTLMLLDIDHFKRVNDSYGHPAGDEVLVGLSSLLKRSCRASDAICRYGGEEIALILADTPLAGAKTFAENLRKTIESEAFSIPDGKSLRITASMGLAEFPAQAASMEELIKHADDALYRAKREGRNVWRAFSA
jgi:diguanylate cyclase (GGDEF)-like protein